MFFVMFQNYDEFNLATSESFNDVKVANNYAANVHPMSKAFVVSNDKKDYIENGKCFVLFTTLDGKIENVRRKEFDSWEQAENHANGVNKEHKAFAVCQIN